MRIEIWPDQSDDTFESDHFGERHVQGVKQRWQVCLAATLDEHAIGSSLTNQRCQGRYEYDLSGATCTAAGRFTRYHSGM